MAYYISVKPFNESKNDEAWDEIATGEFTRELEKEISVLDKKIIELDKDPKIDFDSNLIKEAETLEDRKDRMSNLVSDINSLNKAFARKDSESVKEYIHLIDSELSNYRNEIYFFDPRQPFHDFFSALFKIILNIDIEKDWQDTLSLLPTDTWVQLYKKIDAEAVKKAIGATEDDPEDKEAQKYYFGIVKHIRDTLRNCLDTQSEIRVYDELYDSGKEQFTDERTKKIIEKYFKK